MPRPQALLQLTRMLESVRHKSSYVSGTWIDEPAGVYVGWVARKGSFCDGMPLRNERGDIVLVFSGEDYPEPGIAGRLREHGHSIDENRCSYLVHLYEENPAFLRCLNGRFHGLLVDRNLGTSTLFNDRYGIHRLYYHQANNAFYFAAESKAILAARPELRSVSVRSLGEYVACGCVLENRTLFESIRVLPPGSAWVFRDGQVDRKGLYFHGQEWENQDRLEPEPYYQQVRDTFARNLPRYFEARERIGVSLTGGLDTRMIMAWQKATPGSLPCYSFGGMFRECHDVRLARQVAEACGQNYDVIPVGKAFLSRFPQYAERAVYLTDGCVGVSRSADLYVNEQASEIAPIRMTGNYGSEILRRLVAFKPVEPAPGLFRPEFLSHIRAGQQAYTQLAQGHALSFIAFQQVPWHHYGLLALEQTQLSLRSPFLDNDLVQTAFRAPNARIAKDGIFTDERESLRLIAEGNVALLRIPTDRGLAGNSSRVSTALSRRALEFTFKAEYAYDYGMPQWLAKLDHAFSPLRLERLFLGRHKFCHFRVWYRNGLSNYVQEMLLDRRSLSRPYIDPRTLQAMVRGHIKGDRNYTTEIHTVLTLELFHRLFLESI